MYLTPPLLLLSLLSLFQTHVVAFRNCTLLLEGGPAEDEFDCRAYPGQCAISASNIAACNASGGVCFDDGFCCPKDWQLCGAGFATISACYDPNRYTCCGLDSSPGGTEPSLCDSPLLTNRNDTCIHAAGNLPGCAPLTPQPPYGSPPYYCYVSGTEQEYDSNTYVCIGNQLCPKTAFLACVTNGAAQCFNPSEYVCDVELLFNQSRVGSNGVSTYINMQSAMCPFQTPSLCGDECYDPTEYVCFPQDLAALQSNALCPISAPNLCGSNCYSEGKYQCVNGQLAPN